MYRGREMLEPIVQARYHSQPVASHAGVGACLLAVLALVLLSLAWAQHPETLTHEGDVLGASAVVSEGEGVTALVWAAQAASLHATHLAADDACKPAWLEWRQSER